MQGAVIARSSCASCRQLLAEEKHPKRRKGGGPPKKRRRRGLRERHLGGLEEEFIDHVLAQLARISPRHVLLMAMTSRWWRERIYSDHAMWASLYRTFEQKQDLSIESYNVQQAVTVPNVLPFHPWPKGRPTDYDWYDKGIPLEDQSIFNRYVRKVVGLGHIKRCGVCGSRKGAPRPYWSLSMRVCTSCLRENLVSDRALLLDYGVSITERLPGRLDEGVVLARRADRGVLLQACQLRVFYFASFITNKQRERFTHNPADFEKPRISERYLFFWRPHLEKIIDLGERRAKHNTRQKAEATLSARLRMAHQHRIQAKLLQARTRFFQARFRLVLSSFFSEVGPGAYRGGVQAEPEAAGDPARAEPRHEPHRAPPHADPKIHPSKIVHGRRHPPLPGQRGYFHGPAARALGDVRDHPVRPAGGLVGF
jgi:hypothetical protein